MADDQTMTRAEWERERAAELAAKTTADLASKVAALEFDLKAKRSELDTLKTQLPPEGSVVLRGAEKDRWEAYSALGKPDDLKAALADRDTLTAEKAQRDRRDSIRAAAEVVGYKASVLERLTPDGVAYEVRETEQNGQTVKVAVAKDAEGKETPLSDYAAANFADFLPALTTQSAPTEPARPAVTLPRQETAGSQQVLRTQADIEREKSAEPLI